MDNDTVVEVARRLPPDLSPAQALAAWTEKAAKMPDVDLEYGDARQPGAHYIPGRSRAEESDK